MLQSRNWPTACNTTLAGVQLQICGAEGRKVLLHVRADTICCQEYERWIGAKPENSAEKGMLCAGMTFSQLYRMSRERLLVANDAALRSHLTEFKDHDLLQTRHDPHAMPI